MSSTLSVHRTAYPTCIYQCLCLVPLHLHLARFAELSVLRAGLCITVLLIFLINHAACFWCCLLMSQHKKCIKLLEHSVIMLIFPADWEIYTRIHNMLCNLWFTQNTWASCCWTFGRKPSRLKSTLWYSPYLSSIFNFIMELNYLSPTSIYKMTRICNFMKLWSTSVQGTALLILLEN